MVRPARGKARQSAQKEPTYDAYSFPGPSLGWVSDVNLAMSQPGAAYQLDDIFPTPTGGRLRRGKRSHVEVGSPVKSLFTYRRGPVSKMFGIADDGIYDVSGLEDPEVEHALTEGYCSVAQYTATDGTLYIRGVNGQDTPWVYDGATFDTDPALTFPDGDDTGADELIYTWVFKNRYFFIKKDSLDVYYLPVGQIGGELTLFSLGGVFDLGGNLVFGATWSQETGDGLSAMCIFATDNGEVAVYQGDNPNEAASWQRVGVYTIGKPRGPNAFLRRGGDLVICTDIGQLELSQALQRDVQSLAPSALSRPIEPAWSRYVSERFEKRWTSVAWTEEQMLVVALPTISGQSPVWLVSNATTGKWCRFNGWDAMSLAVWDGGLYFGSPDGFVYQANVGGSDDGAPYTGIYIPVFDQLGVPGKKSIHMARAVMRSRFVAKERLSVHTDFRVNLPPAYDATPIGQVDVWGTAKWGPGVSKWGGASGSTSVQDRWRNTLGAGEAITIAHQVTSASVAPLDTEFIRTDVLFTAGEVQS
ncbi:hypothetical protein GCM10007989_07360 [Devosia pacifica]|uniref:Uncharacterized protein n=2 Tax=Devosia pacifica TaxID=1335967 RepID=A0A918RZB6_9HYPH|nr:hypothetical protein GCM10007989_07360 [Devosia pacifica]